uniref:Retrovirus-related Pol polyprotein from transposon TNT 1-94 n=1 Tax=Cannabis sativa TaxID=3483 RepID=A0A803Q1I6_CANSA
MSFNKTLDGNLDEFLRLHIELANSGENEPFSDNNQAIIILNSLPESYRKVKNAIKYCKIEITLEEVISALKSKDLEIKSEKHGGSNEEVNFSRGDLIIGNLDTLKAETTIEITTKKTIIIRDDQTLKAQLILLAATVVTNQDISKKDCYFLNKGKPKK